VGAGSADIHCLPLARNLCVRRGAFWKPAPLGGLEPMATIERQPTRQRCQLFAQSTILGFQGRIFLSCLFSIHS
ncbi:MAG: hypothetical protein AAFQ89_24905, partial [Cyanobacteria bacterium J06626_18]